MKLKEGKIYHFRFKNDKSFFRDYLMNENFKNASIQVEYKKKHLWIVDKRFIKYLYFDFGFYPERFIINEQLELDF